VPFSDAVLHELYPSRCAYVRRIVAATRRSLAAGYIGAADARATIRDAARTGPYG
jgi:Alpha/beta hydrolase domain